jgi:hypothetical protein
MKHHQSCTRKIPAKLSLDPKTAFLLNSAAVAEQDVMVTTLGDSAIDLLYLVLYRTSDTTECASIVVLKSAYSLVRKVATCFD